MEKSKIIKEIKGCDTIDKFIEHLNSVKYKFEDDPIKICIEKDFSNKDKTVIFDNKLDITEYQKYDWCIGGKKTYEKLCPLFDEIHISIINDETIGDTKAPELILNENCKIFYYEFDVD